MRTFQEALVSGALSTLPFLCLAIALELAFPRTRYTMRDRLPGIAIILTMIVFHVTTILWLSGWWRQIGFAPLASIPVDLLFGWAGSFAVVPATITALLVLDFFGYWYHRIQHSWLWPFHAVHHSVEELHAANNYVHAFEEVLRFAFVSIPLSFLPVSGPVSGKAIIEP